MAERSDAVKHWILALALVAALIPLPAAAQSAAQPNAPIPAPLQPAWETLTSSTVMVPNGAEQVALGPLMRTIAEGTGVRLQIGPLPEGVDGRYEVDANSLTVNDARTGEDAGALAAVLAHELTHA